MKNSYIFIFLFLCARPVFAQSECNDLIISEYVEGWNNNKAIELYNPTPQTITFTDTYRLIRWSNGSEVSDQDFQYVLPIEGTIAPYGTIVMIQDTTFPGQDSMIMAGLRAKATYLAPADYESMTQGCRVVFWNGDDAISLQRLINNQWVDIDIFGEIGIRPLNWQGGTTPAGAWTDTPPFWRGEGAYLTQNQSLVRKYNVKKGIDRATMNTYGNSSTGGYANSFNTFIEYDSLPANTFDSLGFHSCACNTLGIGGTKSTFAILVTPNPVSDGRFTVRCEKALSSLELYTLQGQMILSKQVEKNTHEVIIAVPGLPTGGIYLLKVMNDMGDQSIQKIIIH